jgi:hypothetical protein
MPRMLDHFQLWYFWLCGHFVHEKFGTRYSGHLLSRLAGFVHNLTKQTGFPTTWRENGKSNSEQVNLWFIMRCLVEYEDYLYYMKGKRKEQVNLWLICEIWLSTKTTFTTWRENGKSKWIYDSCDIWSSTMDYLYNFEVDRKRWLFCSLCPVGFKLGWEDWLILDRVMDTPVCRAILTWNGFWPGGSWESRALLAYQNSQAR